MTRCAKVLDALEILRRLCKDDLQLIPPRPSAFGKIPEFKNCEVLLRCSYKSGCSALVEIASRFPYPKTV
jgi:hypothetical protein